MTMSRRHLFRVGLAAVPTMAVAGCSAQISGSAQNPSAGAAPAAGVTPTGAAPSGSGRSVTAALTPRPRTYDLGGRTVTSWGYTDTLGAEPFRAAAGDLIQATVTNQLPAETSIHWHGLRVPNAMDGVPGLTQDAIKPGGTFTYRFIAPDPGTYFFHSHVGVQLDRGLYAPLIIDDPHEPGRYDAEWVVVLDDWTDGIGTSPDEILAGFKAQHGTVQPGMNMGGMTGMGGMHGTSGSTLGDAGDIAYPLYLINGRGPTAPASFTGKPGQRVRLRLINAASDTIFRIGLTGHRLTLTHTDGYPVVPTEASSVYLGMGERLDALVTLSDGMFALVAQAEGKQGAALAVVKTGAGSLPTPGAALPELNDPMLLTDLRATDAARLPAHDPDTIVDTTLNGQMQPYAWGINGKMFGQDTPFAVRTGQRLRMRITNMTMMVHPMHLHGHTWSLPGNGGLRKDTILVRPMQTIEADLQADNPGTWAYHCHNSYHGETGMMTTLRYS